MSSCNRDSDGRGWLTCTVWDCLTLAVYSFSMVDAHWWASTWLTKITLHAHFPVSNHMTSCSQSKYFSLQTPYQLAKTFMNIYEFIYIFFMCVCVCVYVLTCVRFFVTPWTVALQAPLSMRFLRQEYWSVLWFPPPGVFPTQGLNPHPQCLLHCRHLLHHWAMKEAHVCFYIVSILVPKKVGHWLQHSNLCPWNVSQCGCFSKKALTGTEV